MSSMLEQAIVDADQLKETAKMTAEEGVVEKYQDEIKEAIEKILEQEETVDAEVSLDGDTPSLEVVEELPSAQTADGEEVVQIDLNQLEEMMADELAAGELDPDDMLDREQVAEELDAIASDSGGIRVAIEESDLLELAEEDLEEEIELDEKGLAAVIAEMLSDDADDDGDPDVADDPDDTEGDLEESNAGKTTAKKARTEKKTMKDLDADAKTRETDFLKKKSEATNESRRLKRENTSLLKEQTRTDKKAHLLKEKLDKYGTVITKLKTKLNESNLTNAKLLYQNRILNSVSLNERQKDKIVEAISNATTVEEAKLIFETLQSAVGISKKKRSKRTESLNEVVTRSSSAFIPRKEVQPKADAFSERMKRLAGLK